MLIDEVPTGLWFSEYSPQKMLPTRVIWQLYRNARTLPACRLHTTVSASALSFRVIPYRLQARFTSHKSAADEKMEEITELLVLFIATS